MATRTMSRRQKLVAFGPALVAIGLTAVVASGASIIPGATAASTVTVDGTVSAGMSVTPDTTSACGGAQTTGVGDFSDGAFHAAASTCTISFATNGVAGASVTVDDANAAPFFITGAGGTDNTELDNATAAAGGSALGDDQFGIALTATTGTPLPAAGANFEIDATPLAADTVWGPIDAAPGTICATAAVTTATQSCSFAFGVDGQGATQTAGTYSGTLNVLATANP